MDGGRGSKLLLLLLMMMLLWLIMLMSEDRERPNFVRIREKRCFLRLGVKCLDIPNFQRNGLLINDRKIGEKKKKFFFLSERFFFFFSDGMVC